jgi:hypothetical protein
VQTYDLFFQTIFLFFIIEHGLRRASAMRPQSGARV